MNKKTHTTKRAMTTSEGDLPSTCPLPDKVEVPIKEEERAAVIHQEGVVQVLITILMDNTNKEITIISSTRIPGDLIDIRKHQLVTMQEDKAFLVNKDLKISYLPNTSVIQI